MAQITLNSSGVASSGSLLLQTNGTTTQATIDTSGNLGLGVTPSAWYTTSGYKSFELGRTGNGISSLSASDVQIRSNSYLNSSGVSTYANNGYAALYEQYNSAHTWSIAASGTAGNPITFTTAMTLDASGRLGIGNSSPSANLEIGNGSAAAVQYLSASSAGSAIIGRISGSSTWFVGDTIQALGSGTGLINYVYGANPWIVYTNGSERARIDSSGNLLLWNTDTSITATNGIKFINGAAGNAYMGIVNSASTNASANYHLYSSGAGAYRFYVGMGGTINATSTTITALSDVRHKENIRDLDDGLDKVMALKPRKFDWKEGKGQNIKDARGFIAQEFETVFPDMIEEWLDPAPEGEEPYKAVNANLIPTLVKALQEMKAIIDDQATTINTLTARIEALENK